MGSGGDVSTSGGATSAGGAISASGGRTGAGGTGSPAGGGAMGSDGAVGTGGTAEASGGAMGTGGAVGTVTDSGRGGVVGSGGGGGSSNADSGGGGASGCTREFLKATLDSYFKALAAHSAATLPLADNAKFTENGKVLTIGQEGLWKTAGTLKYAHSALDTEGCNVASQAVVPDGSKDIPFALRLKLQNQKITEVETIAVRSGDYSIASNTEAMIASATSVKWEEPVAANQRNTRDEMIAWMDKYFRIFPNGVCNTASTCKRLENGGGSFNCNAGASCNAGPPGSGKPAIASHAIFADVETGIGVGLAHFQGSYADMHMFKMVGGQVYAVHAVLASAASTGWD